MPCRDKHNAVKAEPIAGTRAATHPQHISVRVDIHADANLVAGQMKTVALRGTAFRWQRRNLNPARRWPIISLDTPAHNTQRARNMQGVGRW